MGSNTSLFIAFILASVAVTACEDKDITNKRTAATDGGDALPGDSYVDPNTQATPVGQNPPTDSNTGASLALAAFTTNIEPAIDSTCSKCHASNGFPMKSGDAANNRSQLLTFSQGNAQTLFTFISNTGTTKHSGGNQSAALPLAKIQLWIDAENAASSTAEMNDAETLR